MVQYKLIYFNVSGRAEPSRLLFALAGVEFEDKRITGDEWKQMKPDTPFGGLPVLEVDGKQLCQSNAIESYLAGKFGFAGKNDWDKGRVNMIRGCLGDVGQPMGTIFFEKDEERKAKLKKHFVEEHLPESLGKLEKLLIQNKGGDGYFVGDEVTVADLAFHSMNLMITMSKSDVNWDAIPKLKALKQRVATLPRIVEYYEKASTHLYKLTYFDIRGRAETSRLLFTVAGVNFEDVRITGEQWQKMKPNTPFGSLPILEVDGKELCQSSAVESYLAEKFGLAGKTEWNKAEVNMIRGCIGDTVKPLMEIFSEKEESRKAEMKEQFASGHLPESLGKLEKLLKKNKTGDGYFVGDEVTVADITFFCTQFMFKFVGIEVNWVPVPKLKALHQRVAALPAIVEYYQKDPK